MERVSQIGNHMYIQPPCGAYQCLGCQHMFHSNNEPYTYMINQSHPIPTNCHNSEISNLCCNNKKLTCVKQPKHIPTNCHNSGISNLSLNTSKLMFDLHIQGSNCCPTNVVTPPMPGNCCPNVQPENKKKKIPDDLIETMEHKCHPNYTLKLAFYPAFIKNEFTCAACGGDLKDNHAYGCLTCGLKLHVKCALLPETLSNEEHDTKIDLYYSVESACGAGKSLICSICEQTIPGNLWVYYCQKCEYGTDVTCILAKERLKDELQSYKDDFEPYTSGSAAAENCTRKPKE